MHSNLPVGGNMENLMAAAGSYLVRVLAATISQLFILLGPGIILAVIMYFVSGFVQYSE